jgi:predicted Zn-dependent protease
MRSISILLVFLVTASFVLPDPASAAKGSNWRQRESFSDDITASDVSEEIRFGREVAARIIARSGLYDSPQLNKYVNLVGNAIALNTGRPELQFRFGVLDTDEINAYAAPGGYVFVTKGAMARMHDESELAGVLAHEIAHIVERHIVKELNIKGSDSSGTGGLAMIIGAPTEAARMAFSQFVDKAVDMLFKDGYKREDEAQADRDAVAFCALTGYDPAALSRYFDRLARTKGRNTEVLDKTHPPFDARIASMKTVMNDEGMTAGSYQTRKERFIDTVKQHGNFIVLEK